jgi:IS30 family transposase
LRKTCHIQTFHITSADSNNQNKFAKNTEIKVDSTDKCNFEGQKRKAGVGSASQDRQVKGALMSYTQLSERQRYQISHLKRMGYFQYQIANEVGVHKSTISREVRRNQNRNGYDFEKAQQRAKERRHRPCHRITAQSWAIVETKLVEDWSPEQISGWLKRESLPAISHEWIYHYILRDKKKGGKLYVHLRCQKQNRKRYGSYSHRGVIPNRRSIEERPEIVSKREQIGDWELDTVIGKNQQGALVTIVDRKSRYLLMGKVDKKTSDLVGETILKLLTPHAGTIRTLTSDNGKEFAGHQQLENTLQTKYYFAHPYSSWERGTNENTNGLIRQYIPKGRLMSTVDEAEVIQILSRLNHRPRKCLGFQSPHDIFSEPNVALAT